MAGQGTVAKEMLQQLPELDAVFVSVGGGGLIAGIASFVKHVKPSCMVVGCSAENSACMELSVKAGRLLVEGEFRDDPTVSTTLTYNHAHATVTMHGNRSDSANRIRDQFIAVHQTVLQNIKI